MNATEKWLYDNLVPTAHMLPARLFRGVHHVVLAAGIGAMIAATDASLREAHGMVLALAFDVALAFFAIEYVLRLYAAAAAPSADPEHPVASRWLWASSPGGIIDLMAVLPFAVAGLMALNPGTTDQFAVVWALKLFRYSQGSGMLRRVLGAARETLISVFVAFVVVLLFAATIIHLLEGPGQPKVYGSIASSLWWTIVTLTTTGYGDIVPVTPFGRVLASAVMVCGIAVFALWAGILATAFANEVRRREFLRNWDLIAKVPFFRNLGPATIADIAHILKPREVENGQVIIRRGDPGDCMFFIVSGEIEVLLPVGPQRLGSGEFFGEIALITGEPRTATATATKETQLLSLDIADFRQLTARRPELAKVVTEEGLRRRNSVRRDAAAGE